MSKYLDLISRGKEEKAKAANERAADEAAQQLDVDILTTKRRASEVSTKVEEAIAQVPFNAGVVIGLQRQLKQYEEDLEALTALKTDLF